jgi:hypothetical protein
LLGEVEARQARWDAAASAFRKAVELSGTPFRPTISYHTIRTGTGLVTDWFQTEGRQSIWCHHAASLRMIGDHQGYRRACAALVERFQETSDPILAQAIARCWTLAPESVADSGAVVGLAEFGVLGCLDDQKPRARTTRAAALLRDGRLDEALRSLDDASAQDHGKETRRRSAWLALAHARKGDPMTARRWLDRLRASAPSGDFESFWDEVEIGLLRREAEAVLLDSAFPLDPFAD